MFLAYNNGISVTAESVESVRDENGKPSIKRIRDMQIVNGGQTTASIFNAKNDRKITADPVSYTHLDVYKRQRRSMAGNSSFWVPTSTRWKRRALWASPPTGR